jgi:hypothetical protein
MAGGTVSSGTSVYSSTFTAAGTAEATTFADRYGYVVVTNTSTSGEIYATANGSTASATNGIPVGPGLSVVIANGLALWFQSSRVIAAGVEKIPTGGGSFSEVQTSTTVTTNPAQPGRVVPMMGSLAGQAANPGTNVSLWTAASGGATSYTISGTG